MATILCVATRGTDDPTQASIAFRTALGALEAGHKAQVALLGEATYMMKDYIAKEIHGVGLAPLTELMSQAVGGGVDIFV
ncbi:MAG: hypothetical protein HY561_13220 [Gemmatimonadetes bacterium]|nr:hypothetical protein [Gemmatimonadota bacterium]